MSAFLMRIILLLECYGHFSGTGPPPVGAASLFHAIGHRKIATGDESDHTNYRADYRATENLKFSKSNVADSGKSSADLNSIKTTVSAPNHNIPRIKHFNFLVKRSDICDDDVFLLIMVCSAPHQFDHRMAIRQTWGSISANHSAQTKVLFILGIPSNSNVTHNFKLHSEIRTESERFADIIIADFNDSYSNLSLKSTAMLQWVDTYCPKAKFILKTDDDMFINVNILLRDLHNTVHKRFIMGQIIAGAQPMRDKTSKWYTPMTVYNETRYPNYLSGTAYLLSGDLVGDLFKTAVQVKPFWIEDIFITGFCAKKINASIIYNGKFGYKRRLLSPCLFKAIITAHRMRPVELLTVWQELKRPRLDCDYTRLHMTGLIINS